MEIYAGLLPRVNGKLFPITMDNFSHGRVLDKAAARARNEIGSAAIRTAHELGFAQTAFRQTSACA